MCLSVRLSVRLFVHVCMSGHILYSRLTGGIILTIDILVQRLENANKDLLRMMSHPVLIHIPVLNG